LICDITGASVQFVYDGSTWEVYAQIGGQGGNAVTLNGMQTLTNKTINGASNTLSVRLANDVTGTLPVANGGTGATTLTANNVILGNGTSAPLFVAPGTSGNVLTSNGTTWASVAAAGGSEIVRVARTSNTALTPTNKSNLIDITSGTFTQTFNAAATLGSGWFCYIRNSGTGDITLDPNGSETIDGLTTFIMYPGETRLIQCSGTNFISIVLESFYRTFTSSGTFTKPPGYRAFSGLLWGGGGSGGAATCAAGGGGGACNIFSVNSAFLSASCTVTIGAGASATLGAGGGAATAGNAGGTSSFDGKFQAFGGGGGGVNPTGAVSGGGGGGVLGVGQVGGSQNSIGGSPTTLASGGSVGFGGASSTTNAVGGPSWAGGASGGGATTSFNVSKAGGNSVYGGGGGAGSGNSGTGASGGVSVVGGDGAGSRLDGTTPPAATAPGGGGGATYSFDPPVLAGAGARGELRIWGIV
jgi:hypothetical protein